MKIELNENTQDLIEDAAKRANMLVDDFMVFLIENEAGMEYARQAQEDAKTC